MKFHKIIYEIFLLAMYLDRNLKNIIFLIWNSTRSAKNSNVSLSRLRAKGWNIQKKILLFFIVYFVMLYSNYLLNVCFYLSNRKRYMKIKDFPHAPSPAWRHKIRKLQKLFFIHLCNALRQESSKSAFFFKIKIMGK